MDIRKEETEHEISFNTGKRKKWGLSKRRVAVLCAEGHIQDAQKTGNTWLIPENAEKPSDARIKSGKYIKSKIETEG